ncbi:hypothetical protein LTR17_008851 [Elasticomyces elasticus]|nr:hypothetical protein LTR17_008851 [Elasticomyces elasticus]
MLNRKSVDNFEAELNSADDVEITPEYVILQATRPDGGAVIYGTWIFEDGEGGSTQEGRADDFAAEIARGGDIAGGGEGMVGEEEEEAVELQAGRKLAAFRQQPPARRCYNITCTR